jgi:uncharacterized protein with HEPN domain
MPPREDIIRLRHMLDAAVEALTFAEGKSRHDLDEDRMFARAVVQDLEIIGEAANKISSSVQAQYPDVPWPAIVSMRNRLIHAYFDIDLDRVWDTIVDDLPVLVQELKRILQSFA